MGVSITATKEIYDFDMGYGGFCNLRKNIAYCIDNTFGKLYDEMFPCWNMDIEEELTQKTNDYIRKNPDIFENLDDVLDFLYAPDDSGTVSYKTCGKIYNLIKSVDFGNKCFRYGADVHNDYEEFKEFLKDCYSHRKKMRWH